MNALTAALNTVDSFQDKYPTLAAQRRALAIHQGQIKTFVDADVVESTVGNIIANAGKVCLNDIHTEIEASKPAWQKSYESDMEEAEARREEKKKTAAAVS